MTDATYLIKYARELLRHATPGPWKYMIDATVYSEATPFRHPFRIADCSPEDGTFFEDDPANGNAALIAAAPQLIADLCGALEAAMKKQN